MHGEFEDLLQKPLTSLPQSSFKQIIFIVVDTLDECTEEGRELIPTLLQSLLSCATRPGFPLCVFLTSRPEPHYIQKVCTVTKLRPHIHCVSIQSFRNSVSQDIKVLIRAKLNKDPVSKSWCDLDASIVPNLVSKADGLFVYACTAVDFILGDLSNLTLGFLQERYQVLMIDNSHFGLAPLDMLYLTVLQSVFPPTVRYLQLQTCLEQVLGYLITLQDPDRISPEMLENLTGMPTT